MTFDGITTTGMVNQFVENDKFVARRIGGLSSHIITGVAKLEITKVVTKEKTWEDIVIR